MIFTGELAGEFQSFLGFLECVRGGTEGHPRFRQFCVREGVSRVRAHGASQQVPSGECIKSSQLRQAFGIEPHRVRVGRYCCPYSHRFNLGNFCNSQILSQLSSDPGDEIQQLRLGTGFRNSGDSFSLCRVLETQIKPDLASGIFSQVKVGTNHDEVTAQILTDRSKGLGSEAFRVAKAEVNLHARNRFSGNRAQLFTSRELRRQHLGQGG